MRLRRGDCIVSVPSCRLPPLLCSPQASVSSSTCRCMLGKLAVEMPSDRFRFRFGPTLSKERGLETGPPLAARRHQRNALTVRGLAKGIANRFCTDKVDPAIENSSTNPNGNTPAGVGFCKREKDTEGQIILPMRQTRPTARGLFRAKCCGPYPLSRTAAAAKFSGRAVIS
jgi:hypothetical protein